MVLEYDEKGKYYTDIIKKEVVFAQIQTCMHRVEGYLHIRLGERLSDEINRDVLFLPVTDAKIFSLEGEFLHSTHFLAVNREQIVWLMPFEENKSTAE